MDNRVRWLRISYWTGAAADALVVLPMLSPAIGGALFGIEDFDPAEDYRYAMALGASLMLGWTFLLLWADRRPVERRGILLLTVCPVLVGLVVAGIYAVASGLVEVERAVPVWVFQSGLVALFLTSYLRARNLGEEGEAGGDW